MIPTKPRYRGLRRLWHRKLGTKEYTLNGVKLVTDDLRVPEEVRHGIFSRQYEDTEAAIIQEKVGPNDRVLEIGAGVGFVSILCSQRAGSENVRSFEANPAMENLIRDNYALNDVKPTLEMKAVTRDGAPVTFHVSDNIVSSSIYDRSLEGKEIKVESVALASLVKEWQPSVLVMDIEGAEVDLLGYEELPSVNRMILEVHPHIVGAKAVDDMLARLEAQGLKNTFSYRKSVLLERE